MLEIAGYRIHPAAAVWPPLAMTEYKELVADIQAFGLRKPIMRWQDQIIDGVHRLRACLEEGAAAPSFEDFQGRSEEDVLRYIWSVNGVRRHLPARQRAALAVKMQDLIRAHRAVVKQQANEARARKSGTKLAPTLKTKEFVASLASVSPATAQKALSVGDRAPELLDEVVANRLSLDEAYERVRQEAAAPHPDEQLELIAEEPWSPAEAVKRAADEGSPTLFRTESMYELAQDAPELFDRAMSGQIAWDDAYKLLGQKRAADALQTRHTPDWVVRALMHRLRLPGGHWLDPCCGHVDLAEVIMTTEAAAAAGIERWTMVDIRQEAIDHAQTVLDEWPRPWRRKGRVRLSCYDWLQPIVDDWALAQFRDVQVVILNPPWWTPKGGWRSPRTGGGVRETSIALEFVETAWERCPQAHVVMLHALRLFDGVGCHGGMPRSRWFAEHMPDEYRLPRRASFTGPLGEDAPGDYAGPVVWFHWPPDGRARSTGIVQVLSEGPYGP